MNPKYFVDESDLVWGDVSQKSIFRKLYKNKKHQEMSDEEVNQMLDDFI